MFARLPASHSLPCYRPWYRKTTDRSSKTESPLSVDPLAVVAMTAMKPLKLLDAESKPRLPSKPPDGETATSLVPATADAKITFDPGRAHSRCTPDGRRRREPHERSRYLTTRTASKSNRPSTPNSGNKVVATMHPPILTEERDAIWQGCHRTSRCPAPGGPRVERVLALGIRPTAPHFGPSRTPHIPERP